MGFVGPACSPVALALRSGSMQDTPVRLHTTTSCFATYLLPHVLFVADFEERERIAKVCCLAWNIGLFSDDRDRERHIENTLALFFDNEEQLPPPGVRQGYGEELHMLADLKRDLFPWHGPGGHHDADREHRHIQRGRSSSVTIERRGIPVWRLEDDPA